MKAIRRIWKKAGRPFNALWAWAKGHPKRWQTLVEWTTAKREQARHDHRLNRAKFWAAKRTVYRRKWKRAKKHLEETGEAVWEDWMANGHDANVTQGVKDFIARGVVGFGLYCTSLNRTYVPPGGSYTSWHLQGKAGDIAGPRMAEFQRAEFSRNGGNVNCLELFGPDNVACLKYGSPLTMDEGSALEQLHDSHVHGAFT